MQKTVEYTGVNNRVSPATIELLIGERNMGKTLRQLGQMFDRSPERIRQLLSKYDQSEVTLLAEYAVAGRWEEGNWAEPPPAAIVVIVFSSLDITSFK